MFLCVFKEECVMSAVYNHKTVEKKWQQIWQDEKAFAATNDYSKPNLSKDWILHWLHAIYSSCTKMLHLIRMQLCQ